MIDFNELSQKEHDYLMPTYGRFPAALVSGRNATAVDVNGKTYVDFTSGIGVNALGWCDEGWVSAVAAQLADIQHISNLYYSPVQVALAEKLCIAAGLSKAFLCNSGAEANECAIKLARKYGTQNKENQRDGIITLKNSFHGRTVTTLAATGQDGFHEYFTPFTEGFYYAVPEMKSIELIAGEQKICAVFIELIQGEGGVLPLEKEFVLELSAFCKKQDILLMADEVQTGIGRTGTAFCYEQYGVLPDVVTCAKGLGGGLPIGACLCTQALGGVLGAGQHGSTFGGNPVACAGALEVLSRVCAPAFLRDVREKGECLRKKLLALPQVSEVRGAGMMLGASLKSERPGAAKAVASACVEKGLLVLTAKEALRFLPPLTISAAEIEKGVEILKEVLEQI